MKVTCIFITLFLFVQLYYSAHAAPKVTQAAVADFTVNRYATVLAVEEFEKPFRLLIIGDNEKVIFTSSFKDGTQVQGFSPMTRF